MPTCGHASATAGRLVAATGCGARWPGEPQCVKEDHPDKETTRGDRVLLRDRLDVRIRRLRHQRLQLLDRGAGADVCTPVVAKGIWRQWRHGLRHLRRRIRGASERACRMRAAPPLQCLKALHTMRHQRLGALKVARLRHQVPDWLCILRLFATLSICLNTVGALTAIHTLLPARSL